MILRRRRRGKMEGPGRGHFVALSSRQAHTSKKGRWYWGRESAVGGERFGSKLVGLFFQICGVYVL